MTIIRFKLFKISLADNKVIFDPIFNDEMANFMFKQEKKVLIKLAKKEDFRLVRIIPDELPVYFWGAKSDKAALAYIKNLKKACGRKLPKTEVYKVTEFLKDPKLEKIYEDTYQAVYQSFNQRYQSVLVDSKMFQLEVKRRATYYTQTPLPLTFAKELARKSFALFAAEVALLYQLQQDGIFPELTILGRNDELDNYKYEFFKAPQDRPVFPKLFII